MMRFGQKDAVRGYVFHAQTLNRYLYCINDPVQLGDPSGNDIKTVVGGITGLAAGAQSAYQAAATSAQNMGANKFQAAVAGVSSVISGGVAGAKAGSSAAQYATTVSEAARYGAAAGATAGYYEGIKSGLNYTKSIDNSDRADWKAYRIRYEAELKVQALRESGNYSITAENEIWSRACAAYAGLGEPEGEDLKEDPQRAYDSQGQFLYWQNMQSIAAAVAAGEATEDMMKEYWKAAAKYEAARGKRDSELNQSMFKAEAAICGVSFDDISQDPFRFDALADLLGCEGLHVIRDVNALLSLIEAGYTDKQGIMFDGDRILTDESMTMLEEWKIETDESKQKVIPIVLTIGGAMVYAYAVVQSGGAILMFSSTFLPGMAGSIVSAGTYAGGALLITAEGIVTGSRIEEIATGNNSLRNYLDSNPIGGVVDYESLVEAKDLIFVMYLAAGGEAAKFNREYEELLVASRENSGTKITIDDLVNSSTKGRATKGRTTQYERVGDYQTAVDEFNSLNPQNVRELNDGRGYVGELSDGRTINVRNISSEGSPTIEVLNGKNKIKFRYKVK